MPAKEEVWRNSRLMHMIFGISGVVLLFATLWMMTEDHNREWKEYQRSFRRLETLNRQWRTVAAQNAEYEQQRQELAEAVEAARMQPIAQAEFDRFRAEIERYAAEHADAVPVDFEALQGRLDALAAMAAEESPGTADARQAFLDSLQGIISRVKVQEDNYAREMKFKKADLEVEKSTLDRVQRHAAEAVHHAPRGGEEQALEHAQEEVARQQEAVNRIQAQVDEFTSAYQEAYAHRRALEGILADMTAQQRQAEKALADHEQTVAQLQAAVEQERASWAERILEWPILDAFGRPLSVEQIWLPDLTINYNFNDVARFDRCITCHRGIDKTMPGSATEPAYPQSELVRLQLQTPSNPPEEADLDALYGIQLAETSPFPGEVTIAVVRPGQPGAKAAVTDEDPLAPVTEDDQDDEVTDVARLVADLHGPSFQRLKQSPGLRPGDAIVQINDVKITSRAQALTYLMGSVRWGEPLTLTVRRGAPEPFSSHPRLDLYLGSLSPHPQQEFGCTICHEGQGSATAFKWASHTPNDLEQRERWRRDHGWFHNEHWAFPMLPQRFAQSSCLKCHHDVVELEPSDRYPEPPAPQLMAGFHLIRQYGCFGCHEIQGYEGPDKRIGPDLRFEPTYYAAAQQLQTDPYFRREQERLEAEATRLEEALAELFRLRRRAEAATDAEEKKALDAQVRQAEQEQAEPLKELAAVNHQRDQLRSVTALIEEVIRHPEADAQRRQLRDWVLADVQRAEAAKNDSQAAQNDPPRLTNQSRALAEVLKDVEVPGTMRKVGPSLRYVSQKLDADFLFDWINEPKHFRPSTRMPQFFGLYDHLGDPTDPDAEVQHELEQTRRYEDVEIAGLVEYLLSASAPDRQPFKYIEPPAGALESASAERGKHLFEVKGCLACHSHQDFPHAQANQGPDLSGLGSKLTGPRGEHWLYSWVREPNHYHVRTVMPKLYLDPARDENGQVTEDPAADITRYLLSSQREGYQPLPMPKLDESGKLADEALREALHALVETSLNEKFSKRQAARYAVDGIPPDEAQKLIGDERALVSDEPLTDRQKLVYVGRRALSKYGCSGCHDIPGYEDAKPIGTGLADWGRKQTSRLAFEQIDLLLDEEVAHGKLDLRDERTALFRHLVSHHQREGFLWQKLRAPRSYDYKKTANKSYNERLRMPKFPFDGDQIEQVMTFVLGLVAEPPSSQYVYQPDARQRAILDGKLVLEKYNCGGCHTLHMDQWKFEYDQYRQPPPVADYHFLLPQVPSPQIEASAQRGPDGLAATVITGMPDLDAEGNLREDEDEDERIIHYFDLWDAVPIDGHVWQPGSKIAVRAEDVLWRRAPEGGYLARLIYPTVLADVRQQPGVNPKDSDAWNWLPPPLVNEGRKVQTDWLYRFLLDPYPIRPAVVLRMPKFNLSPEEAARLAVYFAAVDGADYPYDYDPRTQQARLAQERAAYPQRLHDALQLVLNNNYCVKCHLVGDFVPQGNDIALAPNLADVHDRLRPDFMLRWIANPRRILPYTGMPVNIPPDKPVAQSILKGTSRQQLDAVVDLLLNFDQFAKEQVSIKPLVKAPPPPAAEAEASGEGGN